VLAQAAVDHPDVPISQLPMLTEEERRQIVEDWNQTQHEYSNLACLHQLFEAQVRQRPDAVAAAFEEQTLTYHELNVRANQLAHYLQEAGIGPEVLAGIFMERSLDMVASLLAVLKAGGAYVPLDPSDPAARVSFMLQDSLPHRHVDNA
jgi:non-ribosomal peptide synthetase component F